MSSISSYILSIAGIVIFSCVLDFIMPSGKISKNIKLVFSLATILVIVLPLPKLLSIDFDLNDYIVGTQIELQEDYLYQTNASKLSALTSDIENALSKAGYSEAEVSLSCNIFETTFYIDSATIDLSQAIFSTNKSDEEIQNEIISIVQAYIDIEKNLVYVILQ